MGVDLGSVHLSFPAVVLTVFLGALLWLLVWAIASSTSTAGTGDDEPREQLYPRRLDRSRQRALGGVCAGIARYFGWRVGTTRAAFVFLAIFSAGFTVVLVYLVLWRLMPLEPMPQTQEFSLSDYRMD